MDMDFSRSAQAVDHAGPLLCFESFNNSCKKIIHPSETQILLYLVFSGISFITVIGNLLVIIAIIHFKQLHTPTNYLILSLAVADLLMGGLVMPPSMLRSVETCWYLGDLFCKVHSSLDIMFGSTSLLNISCISIDRYFAICHPMHYHRKITPSVAFVMIFMSWSSSALVAFGVIFLQLNILGAEDYYFNNVACKGACVIFQSATACSISSVFAFGLPALTSLIIYVKVLRVAQRQSRSIQNSNTSTSISKRELKATKTLAIIMGVFFMCVVPFFLCNAIDQILNHVVPLAVFDVLVWIGYFNCLCNPFVYAFFYRWFRKAIRIIVLAKIFQVNSSQTDLMAK